MKRKKGNAHAEGRTPAVCVSLLTSGVWRSTQDHSSITTPPSHNVPYGSALTEGDLPIRPFGKREQRNYWGLLALLLGARTQLGATRSILAYY